MKILNISIKEAMIVLIVLFASLICMLAVVKFTRADEDHNKLPKLSVGTNAQILLEVSEDVPDH